MYHDEEELAELERKSETEGVTAEEWLILYGEPLEFEDDLGHPPHGFLLSFWLGVALLIARIV